MDIQQTLIKKKLVIGILAGVGVTFAGGGYYVIDNYMTTKSNDNNQLTKQVGLPNGSNVMVTVNNFLNEIPKPQKVESVVMPQVIAPEDTMKLEPRKIDTLMNTAPVQSTLEEKKPKMLIVGELSANETNANNTVTGINNTIGTGEIPSKLVNQKSPYTMFAGTFLPGIMVTGLNSDLSGAIVATIRNDVYDTTQGKYLMIPQGSRLVGTYNHDIAYGQNRLMVAWNRVIYPNGTSINLHGQPGTDLQGFSGFSGDVDNHYAKIFGSSFVMGLIFGGMTVATGNQASNPYQLSAGATIANQVGAQMSQSGIQVINRGLNIPPTIIISPGYKFNVLLTADLILKPYIYNGNSNG